MSKKPDLQYLQIEQQINGLDDLKKNFDVVEIDESHEKFNLLTCKDIVKRSGTIINFSVWIQLKINKGHPRTTNYSVPKDSKTYLEDCLKDLNNWIELLVNFEKKNSNKQLSLFEDDNVDELEKEPPSPTGGEDNSWNSYYKKVEKVRKNNLKKQFAFFQLFNDHSASWLYEDIDWRKFLPTQEEFETIFKNLILKYKDNPGRFEDGWFDDQNKWITRDGALSDFELLERVRFQTRLYLVPYKSFSYVSTDLSYSHCEFKESIRHRFYFINGKLESYGADYDKEDLPQYNLNSKELIAWLRKTLNVPFKEIDSDENILEKGITQFLDSYLWYGKDEYDWKTRINKFKDWKSFKNDYLGFMKEKNIDNNGSGSFRGYDGFKGTLNFDKNKYGLILVQKKKLREQINRTIKPAYYDDESLVFEYRGDEIFKKAFELFGKNIKQPTLLDFI